MPSHLFFDVQLLLSTLYVSHAGASASRAREELHAPAAGRSPNPGSSRSTRRRRATGERAFRLGRARLEVPVMKRDEIGSPPFFIAEAERHAADRQFSCSRARECAEADSANLHAQTECPYPVDFRFSPRDPARVEGSDLRRAAQCARAGSATGSCHPLDSERRSRAGHRSTGAHGSVCLEAVVRDARAETWRCVPRSPGWRRARA